MSTDTVSTTPCSKCGGSGRVALQPSSGTAGMTEPCPTCDGSGKAPEETPDATTPPCLGCGGRTVPHGKFVTDEWQCAAEPECGTFTMKVNAELPSEDVMQLHVQLAGILRLSDQA